MTTFTGKRPYPVAWLAALMMLFTGSGFVFAQEDAQSSDAPEATSEEAPPEAVPDETQQEPTAEELEGMKDAQNTMQTETAGSNVSVADVERKASDYWGEHADNEIAWTLNNLWIMLAGCLVFIMHLGFASLECGLTRQKNTVNILFKNTMIISIGLLTYALAGFNLMYPGFDTDPQPSEEDPSVLVYEDSGFLKLDAIPDFITQDDKVTTEGLTAAYAGGNYTWYTDFFFQAMFAATCATIVSGAVAGRVKLSSFLVFSTLLLLLCYPVTGSWKWGAGWLDRAGFYDFAGSTLVHSVGGWAALVMAALLGPRIGKYNADGSSNAIPGSNLPLVAVGVFLLWFGWFGFNGGSVLNANAVSVSLVLVTTSMAAAAGGLAAGLTSWVMDKKPDVSMALNGILAGLVGITAGADQMAIWESVVIGGIAGVIVYFSVVAVDKKIDDPVGAISVHLVCGIWGTLAVGIFGALASTDQLLAQLKGILAIGGYVVIFTAVVGLILKNTVGIRVSPEEEEAGLDVSEHGKKAYN